MLKVFIVEIHYDFETHSIFGVYHSKEQADKEAKELEREDDSILDGVSVSEYEVV